MNVIVDYSIPAPQFLLGRAIQNAPALEIELERMVPTGATAIPYFWVLDGDREQFERVLDREPGLTEYEDVDELDDRTLYRAEWNPTDETFVRALIEHDAVLQQGRGDAESWEFRIRFPDSETASAFRTACRDAGIDVTVKRLYQPTEYPDTTPQMTDAQRRMIERAYHEGYFDVPRKVTLTELAAQLDISDQAVNERLRRGLQSLIEATLEAPPAESD